jgi:hypothetical protein
VYASRCGEIGRLDYIDVGDVRLGETLLHHGVAHFATANVKGFEGLGFEKVWPPSGNSNR